MFDCWTEKRWTMICTSEDLTVGNFCLLVNSAGSLIEGEYKIEYLGVEIDFSSGEEETKKKWKKWNLTCLHKAVELATIHLL